MRDVFAVWAHRSPREAWFASQGIKYRLTDEVRRIWTLNDPEAVVAFIEELTPGADGVPLIHATARTWILADARDASRWAMQNFDTRTGEAIVKQHFHDLPYRDAIAIWERLPEALRKTVPVSGKKGKPTVWKRFAKAEPQRAEEWAGWYPELAHLLTGDNPVMVAPENPEEVTPIKRVSKTAGKLALDDPAGALEWIGRFSPEGSDDWASVVSESSVFLFWAKQNPDEALSSFLALDTSHQDKLAPLIFSGWATLDPQHFSALINDRLQPGFARDHAIKALVSHIKSADLEAAREWAQTIDDPKVKEWVFQNIGVRF